MSDFRKYIVSRYGLNEGMLVEFDLSQLEICALAEISGDITLRDELNAGVDIHRRNAAEWLSKDEDKITDEERFQAKRMTFMAQYGAAPTTMAKQLKISKERCVAFMKAFYERYPLVNSFHLGLQVVCKAADTAGEPITFRDITPTKREYKLIAKEGGYTGGKYFSATEAKNYPIQGFATGDLVPLVVNNLVNVKGFPIIDHLVTTVHDSVLLDIRAQMFYTSLMAIELAVARLPLTVLELFNYQLTTHINYDITYGSNWQEMSQLTREDTISILHKKGVLQDDYDCYRNYSK
jgi:DNA polymerase I-like protein with 3'-5' exonuclease and polymerase domains